ncbi:DUF397 domain-containing protein [Streptomyces fulvorobeus]|uniref:DUF397 domain-containing protein n=1 Tax=Streptomyces fulvorobeus TaxID=284028 RepID=A0A7J0C4G2_9ACTN|nr:DUF397 domain-containing protein [Streptomyces fulvorobeus]NYE40969.1 hypothetical protein [Streptomyces fulvorobeus]GFM97288.1 hypothetical protein Sfulv_20990 [Streptomyces fulvorobeus]
MTEPQFFKSSYSSNGGDCIEIAANLAVSHDIVPVRDSKNPSGPVLNFPAGSFAFFIASMKAEELSV